MDKMVGRSSVKFVRKLGSSTIRELVGVYLELKTEFRCFPENLFGLDRIEHSLLTEHIAKICKTRLSNTWQHFLSHTCNVLRRGLSRRNSVSSHKSRNNIARMVFP